MLPPFVIIQYLFGSIMYWLGFNAVFNSASYISRRSRHLPMIFMACSHQQLIAFNFVKRRKKCWTSCGSNCQLLSWEPPLLPTELPGLGHGRNQAFLAYDKSAADDLERIYSLRVNSPFTTMYSKVVCLKGVRERLYVGYGWIGFRSNLRVISFTRFWECTARH